MAGDTGPTTQEVDYLNRVLSPGGVGGGEDAGANSYNQAIGDALRAGGGQQAMPDYSAMRNQIAQTMVSRGDWRRSLRSLRTAMASRAAQPQADPYAALRASMASRQSAADPYAALRASMASRAQPAAGGGAASHAGQWYDSSVGIGENPWKTGPEPNRMAEALAWQEANPYDQYFAPKGPMSGSGDDYGWQNALQPWQGGSTGVSGSGSGMNTSGFLMGGAQTRADPSYWGYTGPGTGWGTNQNAQILWEQLRRANPGLYEQFGGDAGMAAGVAAGAGPGGSGSGAGGSGAGVGTGSGSGSGAGSNQGNSSSSGYSNAGYSPGDVGRGPDLGNVSGAFESSTNQAGFNGYGASVAQGFGPNGFGIGNTSGYSGQPGFGLGIGTIGNPGQGTSDGWGYGAEGAPY